MSLLTASPFLKALGWALLNSVWQFAICWFFYRLLMDSIKNISAAAKHNIALGFLLSGTLSFTTFFLWKFYMLPASGPGIGQALIIENASYYNSWYSAKSIIDALMPYCSLLYLVCVCLLCIKFCLFVRQAGNLQKSSHSKMSAAWRTYVCDIAAQLGIQKEVKALLSAHIDTPQVVGFLKPVILVPAACLANLTTQQLEAVLLHELVHIKRNDYLVNLFVASVEILFFFNPFVKQITASIRKEREYSCDDMVMQFRYQPHHYAEALLMLEKNRLIPVTYGIAASGKNQKQLLTRIERIVGIKNKQPGMYRMAACVLALLLFAFIAAVNPAKVSIDQFGAGTLSFADKNITGLQYSDEPAPVIDNKTIALVIKPVANEVEKWSTPAPATAKIASRSKDNDDLLYFVADKTSDDDDESIAVQTAASKEKRDFSLSQKETVVAPGIPAYPVTEEPYVPLSSFSYQLTQDTARKKMKGLTYNERAAKETLVKTQKALEAINWQKIEKQLKSSPRTLAKLKKEISIQLQNLDWQKINNEVHTQLKSEQLQQVLEAFKQDELIKQYQQNETYYEALRKQLAEQEQLINENERRSQEIQENLEKKEKQVQNEMKKKKIIYL